MCEQKGANQPPCTWESDALSKEANTKALAVVANAFFEVQRSEVYVCTATYLLVTDTLSLKLLFNFAN